MSPPLHRDQGQAAPLYITAVVGLLFVALLFFAFGKADATRNTTQSAADAAALAAAQESRDRLGDPFRENVLDPDFLRDILGGDFVGEYDGCAAADRFAGLNDAHRLTCAKLTDGRWGFTVEVESDKPVGDTVLPGTESQHAEAHATAVVEPKCGFDPEEPPTDDSSTLPDDGGGAGQDAQDGGTGGSAGDGGTGGGEEEKPSPGTITCDGKSWDIDPLDLDLLPSMADLFTVRLAAD